MKTNKQIQLHKRCAYATYKPKKGSGAGQTGQTEAKYKSSVCTLI